MQIYSHSNLESTSSAHSVKSKSRRATSSKFSKNSRNFAKWFFLIFLFPLLDMSLGNIFVSGTCPRSTSWARENGHWNFKIVRLSFISHAHQCLKLNMKEQPFLVILSKKCNKIRSRHPKITPQITFCQNNAIQSYLALVSWIFVLKLQNKRGLSFWEWKNP